MKASSNPYVPLPARIAAIVPESLDTRTFVIDLTEPERFLAPPTPGQFVVLSLPGQGEAAFAVSSLHREQAVRSICLTVRRAGALSSALFGLAPGAAVGLRGPYGRGFPEWPVDATLLFVAGGSGLAPLRPAIESWLAARNAGVPTYVVYGARSPSERILRADLERWRAQQDVVLIDPVEEPDDRWSGALGDVCSALACALAERVPDRVAACGPTPMLAAVATRLHRAGVPSEHVFFAIECQSTAGEATGGRCTDEDWVCRDGPVLTLAELDQIDAAAARHDARVDAPASSCDGRERWEHRSR